MQATSVRERNKQDKRDRIRRAALALFRKQGFERTTTREIAERAGIATGTLFLYARTKEEVLALAFGDEIEHIWDQRMRTLPPPEAGLVARAFHAFEGVLDYLARDRELAFVLIKEVTFIGESGVTRAAGTFGGVIARLTRLVTEAQARRELDRAAPAMVVANNLFAIYNLAVIGWLHRQFPDDAIFRAYLRGSLELCVRGVAR